MFAAVHFVTNTKDGYMTSLQKKDLLLLVRDVKKQLYTRYPKKTLQRETKRQDSPTTKKVATEKKPLPLTALQNKTKSSTTPAALPNTAVEKVAAQAKLPAASATNQVIKKTSKQLGKPSVTVAAKLPTRAMPQSSVKLRSTNYDFSDIKQDLMHVPEIKILPHIPSDKLAKRRQLAYKYENCITTITILQVEEKGAELEFLEDIAFAVSLYFVPCRVVQCNKIANWEEVFIKNSCKLFLCSDYAILQQQELVPFYKENAATSESFLCNTPIFMLPKLSLYFQNSELKSSLWKALCQKIPQLIVDTALSS